MRSDSIWNRPLFRSRIRSDEVKLPEMLIGYLIGPFGALLSSGIFTSFLNKYFTDVLQLNTGFLSALQLLSTVLIVAANLIAGQLIEQTDCLAGKARPWILLSALTLSCSCVLMFVVPFHGIRKMVWVAVAYNLYYAVAFPIYNTANSTLVSLSTRNSSQRSRLASLTNMAALGVVGFGSMFFPVLVSNVMKENRTRWFLVMLTVAILTALTVLLQFLFTRERVTEEMLSSGAEVTSVPRPSIQAQLHAVAGEKCWWIALTFYLLFQWSGALKNGSMSYFCQWVADCSAFGGDYGAVQSLLGIVGAIPMAVAALFVVPLADRFGKRLVNLGGMIVGVVGGVIAGLGRGALVPTAVGMGLKCLGSSPTAYLILAMLADVIDHIEYRTGIRTDGLTMSVYSLIMVAGTPICSSLFMTMLGLAGYVPPNSAGTVIVQNTATRMTISLSYVWSETIAYAIGAVLILFWNVEKNLPEEQRAISRRRG